MIRFAKYQETKDFLLHKAQPSPLISEFANWFLQKYSARLLNIDIEAFKPSELDLKYSLSIIIENRTGNFKESDLSIESKNDIKNKFIELSTKYNFANEHKINNKDNYIERTTHRNFAQIKNLENVEYVFLSFFSEEAKTAFINGTLDEATIFLKNKYPEILWLERWQNNMAVIYHTDAQSDENDKKGINKMIMNDYFEFIKKHDELNFFTKPLTGIFVSQETLNRNYMGKLYYYMR